MGKRWIVEEDESSGAGELVGIVIVIAIGAALLFAAFWAAVIFGVGYGIYRLVKYSQKKQQETKFAKCTLKKYFLHNGIEQSGPFNINELEQMGLKEETLLWFEDLDEWTRAGDIEELEEIIMSTPPPFIHKTPPPLYIETNNSNDNEDYNDINAFWICKNCQQKIDEGFDICWNCGTDKDGNLSEETAYEFKAMKKEARSLLNKKKNK